MAEILRICSDTPLAVTKRAQQNPLPTLGVRFRVSTTPVDKNRGSGV